MIAKLDEHKVQKNKTMTKHRTPTNKAQTTGASINNGINNNRPAALEWTPTLAIGGGGGGGLVVSWVGCGT